MSSGLVLCRFARICHRQSIHVLDWAPPHWSVNNALSPELPTSSKCRAGAPPAAFAPLLQSVSFGTGPTAVAVAAMEAPSSHRALFAAEPAPFLTPREGAQTRNLAYASARTMSPYM